MYLRLLVMVISLFVTSIMARADTASDCARFIVKDEHKTLTESQVWQDFLSVVKNKNYTSKQEAKDDGFGFGLTSKDASSLVDLNISKTSEDSSMQTWLSELYKLDHRQALAVFNKDSWSSFLGKASADLAGKCLDLTTVGVRGIIEPTDVPGYVRVSLWYQPEVSNVYAVVKRIQISPENRTNRKCLSDLKEAFNSPLPIQSPGLSADCKYIPEAGISLNVSLNLNLMPLNSSLKSIRGGIPPRPKVDAKTLLLDGARAGQLGDVEDAFRLGATVNMANAARQTALIVAAQYNHPHIVQALLGRKGEAYFI